MDPSASIGPADLEDISEIQRVEREADTRFAAVGHPELTDGSTIPSEAAERAITEGRLLVARVDGRIVGWVLTGRIGSELCVGQLSVVPSAGRRGIGSALLRRVIADARAAGEPSIVLNTQIDVGWGQPFYERHGFTIVAREAWTPALISIAESQSESGLDWSTRAHLRVLLAAE